MTVAVQLEPLMVRDQTTFALYFRFNVGAAGASSIPAVPGDVLQMTAPTHAATGKYTFTIPSKLLGAVLLDQDANVATGVDGTVLNAECFCTESNGAPTGAVTIRTYNAAGALTDPPSGSVVSGTIVMKATTRRASS